MESILHTQISQKFLHSVITFGLNNSMGKVEITKEQLLPLIEAKLTERKIAKEIGHSLMSTRKAMKRYGLKTWRARKLRTCLVCGKELTGKQVYYCSGKCKQKKFRLYQKY